MKAILLEIRDKNTMIPALAVRFSPASEAESKLLEWAGYTKEPESQGKYIWLAKIAGGQQPSGDTDPYSWDSPTMREAHIHINKNFDSLKSGDVICTEFLRGERESPKMSDLTEAA